MKARDRAVQMILEQWRVQAEALRNPSLDSLRARGRCCSTCEAKLPPPHMPGFRQCLSCRPADAHAVYMVFAFKDGLWHCRFLDGGPHGAPVNEVTLVDAHKVRETVKRGKGLTFAAGKVRMNYALVEHRECKLWLQLSSQQFLDLERHRPRETSGSEQPHSSL